MKTTIITVDEAIARGNYNWKKRENVQQKTMYPSAMTARISVPCRKPLQINSISFWQWTMPCPCGCGITRPPA